MTEKRLWEVRTSWIYPDGTIQVVRSENHENELPTFCKTVENAENTCIRLSCCWGYNAPISEVFLPKNLTIYQAKVLVELNNSLPDNIIKEKVGHNWENNLSWNQIVEMI